MSLPSGARTPLGRLVPVSGFRQDFGNGSIRS
jgi:hypothetical protein